MPVNLVPILQYRLTPCPGHALGCAAREPLIGALLGGPPDPPGPPLSGLPYGGWWAGGEQEVDRNPLSEGSRTEPCGAAALTKPCLREGMGVRELGGGGCPQLRTPDRVPLPNWDPVLGTLGAEQSGDRACFATFKKERTPGSLCGRPL